MLSHSHFLSLHHSANSNTFPLRAFRGFLVSSRDLPPNFGSIGLNSRRMSSFDEVSVDSSVCRIHGYGVQSAGIEFDSFDLDRFADVGNQLADAAGDVIRKYFRKSFDILDKEDLSPVTIADQAAEESMVQIIQKNFPSHAMSTSLNPDWTHQAHGVRRSGSNGRREGPGFGQIRPNPDPLPS